jgi:hypothetical protein
VSKIYLSFGARYGTSRSYHNTVPPSAVGQQRAAGFLDGVTPLSAARLEACLAVHLTAFTED